MSNMVEVSAFREGDQSPWCGAIPVLGPFTVPFELGRALDMVAGSQLAHSWRLRMELI